MWSGPLKKNWIFSSSKWIYQRNEIFNMKGPNETYSNFTSFALFSTKVYCVNNLSLNSFTEKRKKRTSGFRTPTNQKKTSQGMSALKYYTRLLCMDFWLGPIFITQKPSSDFRSLLWGLDWILSVLTGVLWLFPF